MNTMFKANLQFYGTDYDKANEIGLISEEFKAGLTRIFMENYNPFTEVFNKEISKINEAWDETGKDASFGEYVEDINPEYIEFIRSNEKIKAGFRNLNRQLSKQYCPIIYFIDDDGCISAKARDMDLYMRLYLVPA